MSKIIPYERNKYALWYDERPDFQLPNPNSHCQEGDRLLQEGKIKEALEYYKSGAWAGDSESMCSLGLCYQFFALDKPYGSDKAMHYYYAAVKKNHPLAKCLLYRLTQEEYLRENDRDYLLTDWRVLIDYDELEKEVYQEGFGEGLLAQMNYFWYKMGKPVYEADVKWQYEEIKSAEDVFSSAYIDLCSMRAAGENVDDYLNQKGVELKYYHSCIDRADYYLEAEHRDVIKAMDTCLLVKEKNTEQFQKYLDQLYFEDIGPGREEEPFHYFLKSALRKNVYAYEALAKCYEQGIGVQRNEGKAQEWLKKLEECE